MVDKLSDVQLARELDAVAFRAWPAAEIVQLGGWRLRAMAGITRRANSVWPAGEPDVLSLSDAIAQVEAFYAAREQVPRFQLCATSVPSELDEVLTGRGYHIETPVSVCAGAIRQDLPAPTVEAVVREHVDDDWREVAIKSSRFADAEEVFLGMLSRLGTRAGFACAWLEGRPIAAGLGVLDGRWLGVFAVLTLPAYRRSGAAASLVTALAAWGRTRGAQLVYHQTERSNAPTLAMAERFGMREVYGYHYRTQSRMAQ